MAPRNHHPHEARITNAGVRPVLAARQASATNLLPLQAAALNRKETLFWVYMHN